MNLACPQCREGFTPIGTHKDARVLSCGDSYCQRCINNLFGRYEQFQCLKCLATINNEFKVLPINKLYYESQQAYKAHLGRLDWENPPDTKKPVEVDRFDVDYEAKCMNPFCLRIKYRNETTNDLFCSKDCKKEHEQLYNKP